MTNDQDEARSRAEDKFKAEQEELAEEQKTAAVEHWIAGKVGNKLQSTYPRLRWAIVCSVKQQIVIIICPFISTTKGYHLHLKNYIIDQLEKKAVIVAGEILERHGISRNQTPNLEKAENALRDSRGSIVTADSAPERSKCH